MFPTGFKVLCHGHVIIDTRRITNILIVSTIFMSWLCHYRFHN